MQARNSAVSGCCTMPKNYTLGIALLALSLTLGLATAVQAQPFCPILPVDQQLCQPFATNCVMTAPGSVCRPDSLIIDPLAPNGIRATNCSCYFDAACGGITYTATTNTVRCLGNCPVPPGGACVVFVNGVSSGQPQIPIGGLAPGTVLTCGCAGGQPTCEPNAAGTGCNMTACPTGEPCLPRCIRVGPNGQQTVVDCDCMSASQCHINLAPAPSTPTCSGPCPPGFTCHQTVTTNADGSTTYCCDCVQIPPPTCPVADPLCNNLVSGCVNGPAGSNCRAQMIMVTTAGTVIAENCACFADSDCGAIQYIATIDAVRCVGNCPVPPAGNQCVVYINGVPSGQSQVNGVSGFPPNTTFTCGCAPPQQTCPVADPLCQNLASGCVNGGPNSQCRPQMIIKDPLAPGGVRAENCSCFTTGDCGAIIYTPTTNSVRCLGPCPVPPAGNACEVFINGMPSGLNNVIITPFPPGTTFSCGCAPPPPPSCTPNATGNGCNPTTCPTPGETCLPVCIRVGPNGQQTVVECECMPDTRCHIIPAPVGSSVPLCIGACPPGFTCERSASFNPADGSTTYCCRCRPDPAHCEPLPGVAGCPQVTCPTPGEICRPKCIEIASDGTPRVVNCECGDPNGCHAEMGPAGPTCVGACPPGFVCQQQVIQTPTGTTYCCECVPEPQTCPVTDPLCQNHTSGCVNPTPGSECRAQMIIINADGTVIAENCACLNNTDCGAISYLPAINAVRCVGQCPVPPPGNQCVVFINGVSSGQNTVFLGGFPPGTTFTCGCNPPPPPNCAPNATGNACNPTTCPNPGEVCLPVCIKVTGNGQQIVVECDCMPDTECHIIPGPVGSNQPVCIGTCPPGFTCERTATYNPADGSTTYCCRCRPDPVHCEPLPNGSACPQTVCPTPGDRCRPKCIEIGNDGTPRVVNCECGDPNGCRAEFGPAGPICVGTCPPGFVCQQQVIQTPTGTTYCCECVPDSQTCPIGDPICNNLVSGCVNGAPGSTCKAQMIFITPNGPIAENCACFSGNDCGAIQYFPSANVVRCVGACPVPPTGNQCEVFINGVPSGKNTVRLDKYPVGTTFTCNCATPPAPCSPNTTGTGCTQTACPVAGQVCQPRCIRVTANGQQIVVDCDCMSPNECHIEPGPAGTNQPICVGVCPPGFTCERTAKFDPSDGSTTYCCSCRPDPVHCEPPANSVTCPQTICPVPDQTCKARCIERRDDGTFQVINCECGHPEKCHVEMGPAGPICVGVCPPGFQCVRHEYPTPAGVAICCECVPDPEFCEPTANGQACTQFNCPPGSTGVPETCKPHCVRFNPQTGQYVIRECDCSSDNQCFVQLGGPAPNLPHCAGNCPPGTYCVENRLVHPDGTVEICCDCKPITCDCPGDINGDGVINGLDIAGFVRCWVGNSLPGDNCVCADIDGDGVFTPADMQAFIQRLFSKAPCTPCCPLTDLNVNLATGVNANGGLIPVNTDDDDWIVTLDASGGNVPRPATIVQPHLNWQTFPNSQWISANYFGPNGDYGYRICFCLDDRATNVVLTLRARADDDGQVFLNGNFVGNTAGFSDPNPPVMNVNPAFLVAGENCITVRVQNIGGAPTGLNMVGSITARGGKCCCPPADLVKDIKSGVYDVNGPLIPFGQDDDTWTVTCDATNGVVPRPAQTIVPHPIWATIPGTRWISATTGATNGLYCYKYCFCLDPRFKNAALTMSLLADDYAEVYLNGVQVGKTPNGWAFLGPPTQIFVTNQALFKPCENCIEIRVVNGGGVITGMDVSGTITAEDGLCCDDREYSCCLPSGDCLDLAPGVTHCDPNMFPPGQTVPGQCGNYRACCMPNGNCTMRSEKCCLIAGGTPSPAGVACSTAAPQACCIGGPPGCSPCVITDPACCVSIYNGTPQGPGSFCPPPDP